MCTLLQFFKSICHYDASLNSALPHCLFSDNFHQAFVSLFGLIERETVSEIKFCSSVLVERKRQWCYVSFTASSRVCLCSLSGRPLLRSLGVLGCAQAVGGASAVGADRLCLSLSAVSICCSLPDAGLPLPGYRERSTTWTIVWMLLFWPKKSCRFRMRAVTIMPAAKWLLTSLLWRQALHLGSQPVISQELCVEGREEHLYLWLMELG